MRKAIKLNRGKISRQKYLLQLTPEQRGFKLHRFTYMWIFFQRIHIVLYMYLMILIFIFSSFL